MVITVREPVVQEEEDDWDNDPPVSTYNPLEKIKKDTDILVTPQGLTKSQKRLFRRKWNIAQEQTGFGHPHRGLLGSTRQQLGNWTGGTRSVLWERTGTNRLRV